jgi:hypothetical protein
MSQFNDVGYSYELQVNVSIYEREVGGGVVPEEMRKLIDDIEASLKRRIPVGGRVGMQKIRDELLSRF